MKILNGMKITYIVREQFRNLLVYLVHFVSGGSLLVVSW